MANTKNHLIGNLKNAIRSLKDAGFTTVEVGPLTDSNSKRYASIATLESIVENTLGMLVTLRMAGNTLEVVVDGSVVGSIATTV